MGKKKKYPQKQKPKRIKQNQTKLPSHAKTKAKSKTTKKNRKSLIFY